jgi:hypothetical protein
MDRIVLTQLISEVRVAIINLRNVWFRMYNINCTLEGRPHFERLMEIGEAIKKLNTVYTELNKRLDPNTHFEKPLEELSVMFAEAVLLAGDVNV